MKHFNSFWTGRIQTFLSQNTSSWISQDVQVDLHSAELCALWHVWGRVNLITSSNTAAALNSNLEWKDGYLYAQFTTRYTRFEILSHKVHYAFQTFNLRMSQTCSKISQATLTVMVCLFFWSSVLFFCFRVRRLFSSSSIYSVTCLETDSKTTRRSKQKQWRGFNSFWSNLREMPSFRKSQVFVFSCLLWGLRTYCHLLASVRQKDLWIRLQSRMSEKNDCNLNQKPHFLKNARFKIYSKKAKSHLNLSCVCFWQNFK